MDEDEKTGKLATLQSEIRVLVGEEIAEKYMTLVRQWLDGKIRMDQFDRRGQRMNVPLDVHSRYMLQIGELFDLPFENPKDPMVKRVKRKRKIQIPCRPQIRPTISMTSTEKSDKLRSGSLSKRLLLFAITNGVGNLETQSLASAPTVHQRAQEFVDDLLRYASLEKTPHEVTESGFLILNAPINYRTITEVDLCNALQRYPFILPDERLRNLLIENLSRQPADEQKTKKQRKRKRDYANSTPENSTIDSAVPSPSNCQPTNAMLFQSQPTYDNDDFLNFDSLNECSNLLSNGTAGESHLVTNSITAVVQSQPNDPTTSSDQTNYQHVEMTHENGNPDDWLGDLNF